MSGWSRMLVTAGREPCTTFSTPLRAHSHQGKGSKHGALNKASTAVLMLFCTALNY
jgi:hypothetical protein